ncbi:MAG: DUF2332 domain-containing protein [Nocardioides sp.]
MEVVEALQRQSASCSDLGSPTYAELLSRVVDDVSQGGPTAVVLAGHEDDPGPSALGLRLLGSVHRLVLQRRAAELALYYPSVGGTWDVERGWPVFRRLMADQPDAVREWLDRPPQTNEVGRASALVGGLLHLDDELRLPVRLFEIGASGGLNLLADRFRLVDSSGHVQGDPAAAVLLEDAWRGRPLRPWPGLEYVERLGCDLLPVDVRSTAGRLTLTAYVWPDQLARLERLRGALDLAQQVAYEVRRQGAVDFADAIELREGTTTVLWHSVMWQYLHRDEQAALAARIAALGERATRQSPFVHLFLEPTRRTPDGPHDFLVVLESWPTGGRRILGESVGHGLPTSWQ